jgi:serine/threonine protein kinase
LGIASGPDYLQSHNIIHRDLKPADSLLSEGLTPVIANFGFAKFENPKVVGARIQGGTYPSLAPELSGGENNHV